MFQNNVAAEQTQSITMTQGNESRSKTPTENDLDHAQSNNPLKKNHIDDLNFCILLLNDANRLATFKVEIFFLNVFNFNNLLHKVLF